MVLLIAGLCVASPALGAFPGANGKIAYALDEIYIGRPLRAVRVITGRNVVSCVSPVPTGYTEVSLVD